MIAVGGLTRRTRTRFNTAHPDWTDVEFDMYFVEGSTLQVIIMDDDVGVQVRFQWKNPDLSLKNPDFLFRNPDFVLKNVDFTILKQEEFDEGESSTHDDSASPQSTSVSQQLILLMNLLWELDSAVVFLTERHEQVLGLLA